MQFSYFWGIFILQGRLMNLLFSMKLFCISLLVAESSRIFLQFVLSTASVFYFSQTWWSYFHAKLAMLIAAKNIHDTCFAV